MAATLGDVIREIQLTAPVVPALLSRQWVFDAYAQLCSGSRWGWQREDLTIRAEPARGLVSVTVAQGSRTVTSAGLFLVGDVGKQLWLGTAEPLLTIAGFTDANTITLRDPYTGSATVVTSGQVIDAYYQPPAGFQQWIWLSDLTNQRPLPWWITPEEILRWDPARVQVGQPRGLIVAARQALDGTTTKAQTYEWWPRNTIGGTYTAIYLAGPQTAALHEEVALPGVLEDRAYVLKDGVLARCAAYPGNGREKNPYFNLSLSQTHRAAFDKGRADLAIVDDDQNPSSMVDTIDWSWVRGGGGDQGYQWSDALAGGYSGGGGYGGYSY